MQVTFLLSLYADISALLGIFKPTVTDLDKHNEPFPVQQNRRADSAASLPKYLQAEVSCSCADTGCSTQAAALHALCR